MGWGGQRLDGLFTFFPDQPADRVRIRVCLGADLLRQGASHRSSGLDVGGCCMVARPAMAGVDRRSASCAFGFDQLGYRLRDPNYRAGYGQPDRIALAQHYKPRG